MRRKIKFPLIMKDGVEVRNIEELRENFDLEKVIEYYLDGKLQRWLKDRKHKEEIDKISNLNIESKEFNKGLFSIFGIDYKNNIDIDITLLSDRNNKISKLSAYFNYDEIEEVVDNIVFNQEELTTIIDQDKKLIYLYEGEYSIPFDKINRKYIGVGNVVNLIVKSDTIDLNKSNIVLENIILKSKSKVTVISKESKYLKFDNNITYKENNFDDYEVFTQIDKVYDNEEDSYWVNGCLSVDGYHSAIRLYRSIDNKKELIINEMMNVSAFCRYENQIFYIARVKSEEYKYGEHCIYKVNIDGNENIKIASLEKYDYMYLARNDKNDSPYTVFIGVTDKYIVWNNIGGILVENGIYRCKHNGTGIEKIIDNVFNPRLALVDNYLIYTKNDAVYKFDMDTNTSTMLDSSSSRFIKHNKTIFYVKYYRYAYRNTDYSSSYVIYEMDIESGIKRDLIEFSSYGESIIELECDGEYLHYHTISTYSDKTERKYSINLKDKSIKSIEKYKEIKREKTVDECVKDTMGFINKLLGI